MSDEATDEELVEAQATQIRSKKQLDNEPAENGILETVTCTNFMCHGFLEIDLGPLINFIIGQYVLTFILKNQYLFFRCKCTTLTCAMFQQRVWQVGRIDSDHNMPWWESDSYKPWPVFEELHQRRRRVSSA